MLGGKTRIVSYFIHQNGETYGPYTVGQLRSMWSGGQVTGDTLYCEEGYESWLQLRVLADELELANEPPPLPQPTVVPPPLHVRREGGGKTLLVVAVVAAVVVVIVLVAVVFSSGDNPTAQAPPARPTTPQPSTSTAATDSQAVTEEYARRVNAFADKHDMTVEEVNRWDYVLGRRGLTLGDFDQALTKLGQSRDRALGYHVEPKKRNFGGRRLLVGDTKFPQNPMLTEDEESMVKVLKLAGY